MVDLNFHAFLAKSLSISLTPSGVDTNSVNSEEAKEIILVKKMQLGLEKVLNDDISPLTAQISYSSSGGNVVFVVKGGKVFGTVSEGGHTFSLAMHRRAAISGSSTIRKQRKRRTKFELKYRY